MAPEANPMVFTREQARRIDGAAMEHYGIPGIVLMENASRGLALQALRMLGWPDIRPEAHVLILCGGGNNGGDGLAAARHLHNAGIGLTIVLTHDLGSYKGDAEINLNIVRMMNLNIVEAADDPLAALVHEPPCDLIIDGLLGTGLASPVRPPLDKVIAWVNEQDTPVLAIDIPSGLDCDSGEPLGCAVRATATVTFVGVKRGFLTASARPYLGDVTVTDIGVPRELIEQLGQAMPR
ncbi:MAG: NAD(P)H-hydrate epimerase [Planctomycetes bacterium]|nr:NAD(P)H-hydrate epimerase [Planctomycetota bacterium]